MRPARVSSYCCRQRRRPRAFRRTADAVRLYQEAWERCEAQLAEPGGDARELERSAVAAIRGLLGAAVVHGSTEIDLLDHAARRGIELAERLGDRVGLARLHANRGLLLMNGERELFADGLLLVEQAVREVRAAELPNEVAVLERQLSWGYLLDGRFEEAHKTIAGALAQLEQAGGRGSDAYLGGRFFQLRVLFGVRRPHRDRAREPGDLRAGAR